MIYNEYIKNDKEQKFDNLEEISETNIINDELIDKLLKNKNNPFFILLNLYIYQLKFFVKLQYAIY